MFPNITVDTTPAKVISERSKQLEQRLNNDIQRGLEPLNNEMVSVMSAEPPVWRGKRRWNSERQRRYVMAKLRRENNLPYQRSHLLSRAWEAVIVLTAQQGMAKLENRTPGAAYVQSPRTQLMHLDSGWPQLTTHLPAFQEKARVIVVKAWFHANRLD